jgi:anion-transporting  ArsA/GET3 family ATPase
VGRSTVAAAIAAAGARAGRRTLVAELAGRADVAGLLGAEPGHGLDEVMLGRDLYHVSIDRQATLRDYLDHEVPGPLPAGRLTRSRTFALLIDATPGMGELLSIGKVWELAGKRRRRSGARPYDLVVLDGPASGQLMGLLRAPRTFGAIARMGPVARQTKGIDRMLTDPAQTGVVLVAAPEQMAVTEAVALASDLQSDGVAVDQVVINRTVASPFSREDEQTLAGAGGEDAALSSARWLDERAGVQRQQMSRLTEDLDDIPQTELPFLFGGIDRQAIEDLATRLGGGEP